LDDAVEEETIEDEEKDEEITKDAKAIAAAAYEKARIPKPP
jgi:hypothetical protein